jgi:formylmethanofuran dehydrogenase subunit E
MARKNRIKLCNRCGETAPILYRVKYLEGGDWIFVCSQCWYSVSNNNLFYVYGGTWKSSKKR